MWPLLAYTALELAAGGSTNAAHVPEGSAGAVVDAALYAEGGLLDERLRAMFDGGLRTWAGADRPAGRLQLVLAWEERVGEAAVGVGAGLGYEDQPVVFTADGVPETVRPVSAADVRAEPFAAWLPGPWRLEVAGHVARRSVSGGDDYTFADLGGRASARLLVDRLALEAQASMVRRGFETLPVRDRRGVVAAGQGEVRLGLLDLGGGVGWYGEALELRVDYEARRIYDLVSSWFSGWRHQVEGSAVGSLGRIEVEVSVWSFHRSFPRRDAGATTAEAGLGTRAALGYALRPWFEPRLRYEHARASAVDQGVATELFGEHLVLLGVRGRR